MALTAKLEADASEFIGEIKRAEGTLLQFSKSSVESFDVVAKGMTDAGRAASEAAPEIDEMTTSWRDFDSLARVAGVNIQGPVKALEELGKMAGLSSSALALLGPAAAVVGTAIGAWKIGTAIGEFTGLTDAITDGTASLMGWGSAADEAAGAKADAIARAFMLTGKFARTQEEALRLSTAAMKENAAQAEENKKKQEELAQATAEAAKKSREWTRQNQEQFLKDREELADKSKAIRDAAFKEDEDAAKSYAARITAIQDDVFGTAAIQKVKDWQEALFLMGGQVDILSSDQLTGLSATLYEALEAMGRTGQSTSATAAAFTDLKFQVDSAIISKKTFTAATIETAAALENEVLVLGKTAAEMEKVTTAGGGDLTGKQFGLPPGGATTQWGKGFNFIPEASKSIGTPYLYPPEGLKWHTTPTITNNFNVVDTESGIARRVSDTITRQVTSSTQVRPV